MGCVVDVVSEYILKYQRVGTILGLHRILYAGPIYVPCVQFCNGGRGPRKGSCEAKNPHNSIGCGSQTQRKPVYWKYNSVVNNRKYN